MYLRLKSDSDSNMKKSYVICSFVTLIITLFISSCLVEPKYPAEPTIEFSSIKYEHHPELSVPPKDSIGTLIIMVDFKDGDGDLGHNATKEDDPKFHPTMVVPINGKDEIVSNPDFPNFYISLLIKNASGEYEDYEIPDGLTLNGAFQRLNNDGKPKPIEGTITYYQKVGSGLAGIISEKSIKFRIKVKDRAFNLSNEILTDSVEVQNLF